MRIESLSLKNFRGIEELNLNFADSQTTVLVGVNGSGKSSILDAITIPMFPFLRETFAAGESRTPVGGTWTRHSILDRKIGSDESTVQIHVRAGQQTHMLKVRLTSDSVSPQFDEGWKGLLDQIGKSLGTAPSANIPIVVYYPVGRVVSAIALDQPPPNYRFDQLTAYQDVVAGRIDFDTFFRWYRAREDIENEGLRTDSGHRDIQMEAVRNAVYRLLPQFSDLRVRRSPYLGMIVKKQGQELDLNQLSDGEKCLLAMIGDIARRLAIANPSLDDPLSGEGVVLIDEIDLHLHPGWQRKVIPGFERAFPNCQFIVATHSPQVLSTAKDATVYLLLAINGSIKAKKLPGPYGKDTNTILEELMEVEERPPEIKERILDYFDRIESGDLVEAEQLRQALAGVIGEDDPQLVRGEVMTRRKEILKK